MEKEEEEEEEEEEFLSVFQPVDNNKKDTSSDAQ